MYRLRVIAGLFAAVTATVAAAPAQAGFVTRDGNKLMLDGKPFRFSGANIEWLGLVGYGEFNTFRPENFQRFPTKFEIDDALETVKEMGGTVVRAQTLGDTVGCPTCLQPKQGKFNEVAFRVLDYVVMRAGELGIKLQPEFVGDARSMHPSSSTEGSSGVYEVWNGGADFYTDPGVWKHFEEHVRRLVTRVNSYTGIPYNEDPTIMGWIDCNGCGPSDPDKVTWSLKVAALVKKLAPKQLTIAHSNVLNIDPQLAQDPNVDMIGHMIYPHWFAAASGISATGAIPVPQASGQMAAAYDKVFYFSEMGWDPTNWTSQDALSTVLATVEGDRNIAGDLVWALESHTDGHGWKALPEDEQCQAGALSNSPPLGTGNEIGPYGCYANEDGNWWALYYTGRDGYLNKKQDMAQRAQLLRGHGYRISGRKVPSLPAPATPTKPLVKDGRLYWQGAVGASTYSFQEAKTPAGPWTALCDDCADDMTDGLVLPPRSGPCLRVIGLNMNGVAGEPSTIAGCADPTSCKARTIAVRRPAGARVRYVVDGRRVTPRRGRRGWHVKVPGNATGRARVAVYADGRRVLMRSVAVCRTG